MSPLLEASGVKAGYGPIQVLHGIDFHVNNGEAVVILGANGAGKTTTLRAISGMINTSGSIKLDGKELVGTNSAEIVEQGLAHVPQGRGTFPELSVEDNLRVGAYVRKDNEIEELAVARALMCRPRLLLLDEPSLGLAPLIVADLFERFGALNKEQGITLLVVEQNATLALGIADRGYVLESGEITVQGPAEDLIDDDNIRKAYLGI